MDIVVRQWGYCRRKRKDKIPGFREYRIELRKEKSFMRGVGFQTYQRTDVTTADPKRLVIMCYEGAIFNLKLAKAKFYAHDYEAKGKSIQNTLDILNELRSALDFEKGGEIAKNLDALYAFWTNHILKSDRNRDMRGFDHVAAQLEEIKSALEEAYFGQREGQTLPLPFGSSSPQGPKETDPRYPGGLYR
jgi:flagellar protein FliS